MTSNTVSTNKTIFTKPWLHIIVLILIVLACFSRTLGSYFLADDFGEVHYVYKITQGSYDLLWQSMTGNYMGIAGMSVWRPVLLLSLLFDFLLWKTNAFGYYLTNLLCYTADVVLFYLVLHKITNNWARAFSARAAFIAAAIFAANPLHCESISWVVGRVDIISCLWYLSGLLTFLHYKDNKKTWLLTLGNIFFWLGLWTKEMAIGLPIIVTGIGFLDTLSKKNFLESIKNAWALSSSLWISTIIYLTLRYMVLGTLTGGYTAGFGAAQLSTLSQKWTDLDTLHRLVFPLTAFIYKPDHIYATILSISYLACFVVFCVNLLCGYIPWRKLCIIVIWAISAAVPIYQLWGLGFNLEGARFYFFLSLALSAILPIVLLPPFSNDMEQTPIYRLRCGLYLISCIAFLGIFFVYQKLAYTTNLLWVHAGKEVHSTKESALKLIETSPPNSKFVVLGIPKDHGGAHMLLNGSTFETMLNPPFTNKELADQFITFDPIMFGPDEFISANRFKQILSEPNVKGPYVWDEAKNQFLKVAYNPTSYSKTLILTGIQQNDKLRFNNFDFDPRKFDFIQCILENIPTDKNAYVKASWNDDSSSNCQSNIDNHIVLLRPSKYWRWFSSGNIKNITLSFSGLDTTKVKSITLLPAQLLVPSIKVLGISPINTGVYYIHKKENWPIVIALNISGIKTTSKVILEITKANFFFDNFAPQLQKNIIGHKITIDQTKDKIFTIKLTKDLFPQPGYYQIRAIAEDNNINVNDEYSDIITINAQ